ncbi:hypothetical protein [Sphingobacterium spiritivorum]|uniref:hypothetical protein n=1 Tax=Sphingobacterium spiritivorum TaxID=258 RepID=UPI001919CC2D|nr:hypothetical protein [Sphingobacterium spiritivorum]QQT24566.1 hypothetical protein I6J02_12495 [Sphingobacterium spiritivorum]
MKDNISGILTCGLLMLFSISQIYGQQVADEQFSYPITAPRYRVGNGPLALFDEAHHNSVTLKGTYAAFSNLLIADGYRLLSTKDKISSDRLSDAKIYISVNAMFDPENWNLKPHSAFSEQEIEILRQWVYAGGSLFLVTDHMPCGGSVQALAATFGIQVVNGFALRKDGRPEIFSRDRKSLLSNEITNTSGEEIDSIMCWGGTGFLVPSSAHVISMLNEEYDIYLPDDVNKIKRSVPDNIPRLSATGFVNGAYLRFGKGRVVIFGDAAPFSAQLQGIKSEKRGMNHPSAKQNAQFLLNIVHWLDQ